MNKFVFLFIIIILAIGLPLLFNFSNMLEGYSNHELIQSIGIVPNSQTEVLVQDTYPPTGKNETSNNNYNQIWWHYPTFKLGSYDQITNNIRYSNNPDLGSCMPESMCGALYHENQLKSNYVKPLPPLNPDCGTRVGYFDTGINLLPFRSGMQNILY